MKKNYFQDYIRIGGRYYLHINFMNMSFIFLDEQAHGLYAEENDMNALRLKHSRLYDELKSLEFIIEDDIDEHSIVEMRRQMELHDKSMYHLIINPTLDCNLSCWYCYENRKKGSAMRNEVTNGVKRHIEESYGLSPYNRLSLSFFGGEPFVKFDAVKDISSFAKTFCQSHNINLNVDFTTNGTLITKAGILFLSDFNCTFQITLDGNKEQHEKVKFSKKQKCSTYTTTLNKTKQIQELIKNSHVFLRINFDEHTLENFDEILSDIDFLDRRRTTVILKRIWQIEENVVDKGLIINAINKLFNKGYVVDYYTQGKLCFAERLNETVINYDGSIYKCTTIHDFNEENSYGKLNSDTGQIEWKLNKLAQCTMNLRSEKCKKCKIYPSCYGPCNNHMLAGHDNCYLESLDLSKEEYFLYLYKSEAQRKLVFSN